ncbi:hypothetical protein J0A68_03465 [Algoriphagus sp. H41]|uniref:Uncharacterized protein n=1 Tax=Algoriphagus oliviformis TaxID=2811231 RepID=A0ABS3BYQ4_9BACT|nr:hypothetical protein [Algoriphagus oliviformis]MBN7809998.1 hypothetical protein [Algoriphagus oliviformis]
MRKLSWWTGPGLCLFLGLAFLITSCLPTVENEQVAYSNDFSDLDLAGFENAKLYVYNNDTVVGIYHNDEVAVNIKDLPSHNYLKVTLEILVHDSWDGNSDDGLGGPDYWYMGYDGIEVFRTTFSNTPCASTYCLYQSYPNDYFRQNVPKSGAIQTNLPGLCIFGPTAPNYTTRYSISKLIEHSNPSVKVYMGGDLTAVNAPSPICDESWSLAKVEVVAIQTN